MPPMKKDLTIEELIKAGKTVEEITSIAEAVAKEQEKTLAQKAQIEARRNDMLAAMKIYFRTLEKDEKNIDEILQIYEKFFKDYERGYLDYVPSTNRETDIYNMLIKLLYY